jgi:hypothetical protein
MGVACLIAILSHRKFNIYPWNRLRLQSGERDRAPEITCSKNNAIFHRILLDTPDSRTKIRMFFE